MPKNLVCSGIADEDFGRPPALLANRGYVTDTRSAARGRGIPGIKGIGTLSPSETNEKRKNIRLP